MSLLADAGASCEHEAVVARVKQYVALWLQDKRMKVSGEILLREIARYEREESERFRGREDP